MRSSTRSTIRQPHRSSRNPRRASASAARSRAGSVSASRRARGTSSPASRPRPARSPGRAAPGAPYATGSRACSAADCRKRRDPFRRVVQARDQAERFAASLAIALARTQADLLERLQAIGRKAGAHYVDAPRARLGELDQCRLGRRLEPACVAEARLERDPPGGIVQLERSREQPRRLAALCLVILRAALW